MRRLKLKQMVQWTTLITSFIAVSILGNYWAWSQTQAQAINTLQHVVNDDMQSLEIYHHLSSSELMQAYIQKRNTALKKSNLEWQTSFNTGLDEYHSSDSNSILLWHSALTHNRISVSVTSYTPSIMAMTIAILSAMCFFLWCRLGPKLPMSSAFSQKPLQNTREVLVIDLASRQLKFRKSENSIVLPNKPFCMYLALLQFCSENRNAYMSTRDTLPQRYLSYCNRNLSNLMENGHSRRRPLDFEAGKDKSLSEIRSAIEALCDDEQQLLQRFLPPKAMGQGSRKVNSNFALQNITLHDFTIID